MTAETAILADSPNLWNADFLHRWLAASTGFPLPVRAFDQVGKNVINMCLEPGLESLGKEAYRLAVSPEAVTIQAPDPAGVFYGLQSLRQLLPVEVESPQPVSGVNWQLACQVITDAPRFSWRGFMLDEGRHFHGKETVLLTLDLMALQKLNVFHWHLTEDQGWRIEIKKYPQLTGIGSWRAGTSSGFTGLAQTGIPHAGFYTQAEIREIVAYAAERHITIVPEVEMPGHALAALAAYPEYSCTGGPFEVGTHFGIYPDIFCAGKETTFTFLEDVLDEVLELFPSPTIHIGGDEAPKKRWKTCPDCQRRIREERLPNEHALQVYFTNRIAGYLHSKGRRAMGWNEILQPGLVNSAVLQYWLRGRAQLLQALRNDRRPVVMSTYLDAYLDHAYSLMPLRRAYRFEPIPKELLKELPKEGYQILGLEFPLWTEWVPDRPRLDYQVYPRLTAMAETAWTSKDRKDLADFRLRLAGFMRRLDLLGVRHASLDESEPAWIKQVFGIFSIARPQTKIAGKLSTGVLYSSLAIPCRRNTEGNQALRSSAMNFFQKILTAASSNRGTYYSFTVKCSRCGEIIHGQVNVNNDPSLEIDDKGKEYYICRKVLVGNQHCFQRIEVIFKFNEARRLLDRQISGGEFLKNKEKLI